jgi:hypothetical protein
VFLLWPASLIVLSFQIVGRFLFQQLLRQPLDTQTEDQAGHIALTFQALIQQFFRLLADLLTWWYPFCPLDVGSVSRALYLTLPPFYRSIQPLPQHLSDQDQRSDG